MARARLLARILLPLLVAALPGLVTGPDTALAAKKDSARLYRLTIDYTGKYTSALYSGTPLTQYQGLDRITTYRARSTRPFYIRVTYRGTCRRIGCLRFRTPLTGSLTHWGAMWERQYRGPLPVAGTPMQNYEPKPGDYCTQNLSESGTGGLTGRAEALGPPAAFAVSMTAEAGTDFGGPSSYDDGCGQPVQFATTGASLVMAPSDTLTEPSIDVRRKLGRAFTISYAPGALDDKPNRVRPTMRETYDFAWTLRFTPARKHR